MLQRIGQDPRTPQLGTRPEPTADRQLPRRRHPPGYGFRQAVRIADQPLARVKIRRQLHRERKPVGAGGRGTPQRPVRSRIEDAVFNRAGAFRIPGTDVHVRRHNLCLYAQQALDFRLVVRQLDLLGQFGDNLPLAQRCLHPHGSARLGFFSGFVWIHIRSLLFIDFAIFYATERLDRPVSPSKDRFFLSGIDKEEPVLFLFFLFRAKKSRPVVPIGLDCYRRT